MRLIPWRIAHFFNLHFHKIYMFINFGTTNLNTCKYWDKRFEKNEYKECDGTEDVFCEIEKLITPGSSVLDVGVGSGYFLKRIRESKTSNVFGLDISSVAIKKLNECGINGCCCELPTKPSISRQFDFIITKALLEHLKYSKESLCVLAELLKPDGKLIVSVPNNILGPESEPEHFRKYDATNLHEELSDCFDVKSMKVIGICLLAVCDKKSLRNFA